MCCKAAVRDFNVECMPNLQIAQRTLNHLRTSSPQNLIPELSLKLAREQVNPKTVVGRVFATVALIVASIAAAIAPSFGLFGPRYGLQNEVHLFIAITSTIAAIGLSQYVSSHLWPERPWAESEA